ncbi:hypothetical protein [Mycobacteroides chelonae]|uniref:hypothetical protein n=1 Tax=Mycobacteroides chelonae TaxID=1774 RepID=UPI000F5105A5|nr:hypothetical protein [Mycobacteroides chelonae]
MSALYDYAPEPVPQHLCEQDRADERPVVTTSFPQKHRRAPWQPVLEDLAQKVQELRIALEHLAPTFLLSVVEPFLHPVRGRCITAASDSDFFADEDADPAYVEVTRMNE